MRSSFKAKDGVRRPVTAETETISYLLNGSKTYELQNRYASGASAVNCHAQPYKAVKLGSCTRAGHTEFAAVCRAKSNVWSSDESSNTRTKRHSVVRGDISSAWRENTNDLNGRVRGINKLGFSRWNVPQQLVETDGQ